ncbi:MAG: TraR/DksA C4-type zinc finger protein [Actinobacteria bacterium]|nr:TraR/DksA C4-type zinc finger protein [Actinomycetota bacterium]MCL6105376.1 TraR/DksA C4-type zinc finger protein [Actinomycetota bacterium]
MDNFSCNVRIFGINYFSMKEAEEVTDIDWRALLEAEKKELLHELAELGFGESGKLDYDTNFADSSQVTAERGEAERLARELKDSLEAVEKALLKLADGTYGVCEKCGNPISQARLEAKPAARFCMNCASTK